MTGIGLSSSGDNYYLTVGNGENFIQLTKDNLVIKTNDLRLDAWDETNGGIQLLSDPASIDNGLYYFKVGNKDYHLAFDKNGNLILHIKDICGLEAVGKTTNNSEGSLDYYLTNIKDPSTALGAAILEIEQIVDDKLSEDDLTSDIIWKTLLDGGKLQGGVFDDSGNYYISASVISTGVLKSANVEVNENADGTYSIEVAEGKTGVYMDLNKGLLWANEFDLLVQPTYVDIMQGNKAAIILTNQPKVKSSDEATTNQAYYLFIGNSNGYLSFDDEYNLTVSGIIKASAGSIGGWEITPSSLIAPNKNLHIRPDMIFGGIVIPEELKFLDVEKYDIDSGEVTNYGSSDASHYNFAYEIMTDEAFIVQTSGETGFFLMDEIPSANANYFVTLLEPDVENRVSIEENNLGRILLISRTTASPFSATPGFILTSTGKLYASGVDLSGRITATSGEVGGWDIDWRSISNTYETESEPTTTYYTGMYSVWPSSHSHTVAGYKSGNWRFVVGSRITSELSDEITKDPTISYNNGGYDFKFGVTREGYLCADNAHISGDLTITSGSININDNFEVDSSGNLYAENAHIGGTVNADSGSIGDWILQSVIIKDIKDDGTGGFNGFTGVALKSPSYTGVGYESQTIYLTPKGCYRCMSGSSDTIYFNSWSSIIGYNTLGPNSRIEETT